jgi:hypothetical protein
MQLGQMPICPLFDSNSAILAFLLPINARSKLAIQYHDQVYRLHWDVEVPYRKLNRIPGYTNHEVHWHNYTIAALLSHMSINLKIIAI